MVLVLMTFGDNPPVLYTNRRATRQIAPPSLGVVVGLNWLRHPILPVTWRWGKQGFGQTTLCRRYLMMYFHHPTCSRMTPTLPDHPLTRAATTRRISKWGRRDGRLPLPPPTIRNLQDRSPPNPAIAFSDSRRDRPSRSHTLQHLLNFVIFLFELFLCQDEAAGMPRRLRWYPSLDGYFCCKYKVCVCF